MVVFSLLLTSRVWVGRREWASERVCVFKMGYELRKIDCALTHTSKQTSNVGQMNGNKNQNRTKQNKKFGERKKRAHTREQKATVSACRGFIFQLILVLVETVFNKPRLTLWPTTKKKSFPQHTWPLMTKKKQPTKYKPTATTKITH